MEQTTTNSTPRKNRKTKDAGNTQSEAITTTRKKSSKRKSKSVKSLPAIIPTSEPARLELKLVKTENNDLDSSKNDDLEKDKTSDEGVPSYDDMIPIFCGILAEDFWESAWDICETRFFHANAPLIVASDLRDAWLAIIDMSFMDTDPGLLEQVKFPTYNDDLPLPPKFDFWSHGALELLPRTCRESVMDPFLREPFPWFLEHIEEDSAETAPSALIDGSEINPFPLPELIRPTSPVPTSEEEGDISVSESAWSVASTAGSFERLHEKDSSTGSVTNTPKRTVSLTAAAKVIESKTRSIQFLYPSKIPVAKIKATSEIIYKRKDRSSGNTKGGGYSNSLPVGVYSKPKTRTKCDDNDVVNDTNQFQSCTKCRTSSCCFLTEDHYSC